MVIHSYEQIAAILRRLNQKMSSCPFRVDVLFGRRCLVDIVKYGPLPSSTVFAVTLPVSEGTLVISRAYIESRVCVPNKW